MLARSARLLFLPVFFLSLTLAADVTLQELENLGIYCSGWNSCSRPHALQGSFFCDCSADCGQYGTCCLDAENRNPPNSGKIPSCLQLTGSAEAYFMFDSCPVHFKPNTESEHSLKRSCEDSKVQLVSDVPVTSLATNLTYKNIFCLRCNEARVKFVPWNIEVVPDYDINLHAKNLVKLKNNNSEDLTSVASNGQVRRVFAVVKVPDFLSKQPKACVPEVRSSCPLEYERRDVIQKCQSYASYITVKHESYYKNPHCALCNLGSFRDHRIDCGVKISMVY